MTDPTMARHAEAPQAEPRAQQPLRPTPREGEMWRGLARMHDLFDEWEAERRGRPGWLWVVLVTLLVSIATWVIAVALGWGARHY